MAKMFLYQKNPRGRSPARLRMAFAEKIIQTSLKIHAENQKKPLAVRHVVNALLTL